MNGDTIYKIGAGALGFLVIFGFMGLALFVGPAFGGTGEGADDESAGSVTGSCELTKEEVYAYLDSHNDKPPRILIPVYRAAADRFGLEQKGPSILAGHHMQETNFGRSTLPGVRDGENGSGAGGPMQFLSSSWDSYGVDGNGDGKKDRYDTVDAIFAAAKLLKANGAPGDWRTAIARYYGADVDGYVDSVLGYAEDYDLPGPAPCP